VPPGSVGEEVEVFVIIPEKPPWRHNVLELLTEIRRRHVSRTLEEIDRELEEERNSWDN
jgi:HEPN domain-containing protein